MANLKNLDVVRALNAPTRAAATRRRRLRKLVAIGLFAGAVLTMTGGPHDGAAAQASPAQAAAKKPNLEGRHLVSVPMDAGLRPHLKSGQQVDVWSKSGTLIASKVPIVSGSDTPKESVVQTSPKDNDAYAILALKDSEMRAFARNNAKSLGAEPAFTLSLTP